MQTNPAVEQNKNPWNQSGNVDIRQNEKEKCVTSLSSCRSNEAQHFHLPLYYELQ